MLGSDIDTLLLSLRVFSDQKNFAVLRSKLTSWATAHKAAMSSHEVEDYFQKFIAEARKCEAVTKIEFDASKVEALAAKLAKPMPPQLMLIMKEAFPWLLMQTLEEVRV